MNTSSKVKSFKIEKMPFENDGKLVIDKSELSNIDYITWCIKNAKKPIEVLKVGHDKPKLIIHI